MSHNLTATTLTEAVQRSFDTAENPRVRQLFVALVGHLHRFAREVHLSSDELYVAADFIKRLGEFSSPTRQEVLLLSDILGLSVLVELLNQDSGSSATESSVLGPFFRDDRPDVANGDDIANGVDGTPLFVTGWVKDEQGNPVRGAKVDTWHSDGDGLYDLQQPDALHGKPAMRARLTSDDSGQFNYRSVCPAAYPVATDGPCGEIMRAANRSVMRPQHIHFQIHSDNHQPLVTQLLLRNDPYLDSDSIFASRRSLLADFVPHHDDTDPHGDPISAPFVTVEWTFILADREYPAKGLSD